MFFSAGETSGESHAVKVLEALRQDGATVDAQAFGGPQLQAAGAELLYPLSDRAVMGLLAVFQSLPFILGAVKRFLQLLDEDPPDLVVLVDYPGLHLVLARLARRRGIPVLHYIAPQYWAWGPWRMQRYRQAVDATLTILPFEPAFFAAGQVPAAYVGHPLLDQPEAEDPLQAEAPALTLLPGSRRREIEHNLPGMLRVAAALRAELGPMPVLLPHSDPRREDLVREVLAREGVDWVEFVPGAPARVLGSSRVVLAKSGTGSLECCLHGVPTVVVYQLSGWVAELLRRYCLSVPWIASANLIAGEPVVPEHCFRGSAGWQDVSRSCMELWSDGPSRAACLQGLATVRERLGEPGASARVAAWIRPFCPPQP